MKSHRKVMEYIIIMCTNPTSYRPSLMLSPVTICCWGVPQKNGNSTLARYTLAIEKALPKKGIKIKESTAIMLSVSKITSSSLV